MLRIPHCLDSRFTDGGEVGSLLHRVCTLLMVLTSVGGWFIPRAIVRLEQLDTLEKILWSHQDLNLSACSIVLQPYMLPLKGGYVRKCRNSRTPYPMWRRVRILPPQSLRVVRRDKKGNSLRWDGKVLLLVINELTRLRLHCKLQTRPLIREGALGTRRT
jgi:hypothetical protein